MSDAELEALRAAAVTDEEIPEAVRGFLSGGAQLDALRLTALGRWTYNGRPVEHPRVIALFGRSLFRTTAGTWVLRVPPYTYPVLVDGAGEFIDKVRAPNSAEGDLKAPNTSNSAGFDAPDETPTPPAARVHAMGRTLGGTWAPLDLFTLETDGNDYLGLRVGARDARLIGTAYSAISAGLDADDQGWFVRWNGDQFRVRLRNDASASSGIS